jgi:hypothetical protein
LNSYGTNWGEIGFGPVYFSDTYKDWFYIRKVKAPKEKNNEAISSNFAHESSEEVEHPRQRHWLNKDCMSTDTSLADHQAPKCLKNYIVR